MLNEVSQLYNKYVNNHKRNYGREDLNKEEENFFEPNQFKVLNNKKQKLEPTEEKIEKVTQKPMWFKINTKEFGELTGDIYNNQNEKDLKLIISKKNYDLKNAKKIGWK